MNQSIVSTKEQIQYFVKQRFTKHYDPVYLIKNFRDAKRNNGDIYIITKSGVAKYNLSISSSGKDYQKKLVKQWKRAEMPSELNSDLCDEEHKHICEMIQPEILICGGRIDGSLFLFDLKKSKTIGTLQKHQHLVINLKAFKKNRLISVDCQGIINIFEISISQGKVDFELKKNIRSYFEQSLHSLNVCVNNQSFIPVAFGDTVDVLNLNQLDQKLVSFQLSNEMRYLKNFHLSLGYVACLVFVI